MPEDQVVKHCAPTLAGLKTGNIFMTTFDSEKTLDREILRLNGLLCKKGLKAVKLRARENRALIYVYRPGKLQKDLDSSEARKILKRFGYTMSEHEKCVDRLCKRMCERCDFPHEVGLFLGYPPEDVKGFIKHGGRHCKSCGHWKVYGDVQEAQRQFNRYSKCTGVYMKCLRRGVPFERLLVESNDRPGSHPEETEKNEKNY